jgi:hypothetical protein
MRLVKVSEEKDMVKQNIGLEYNIIIFLLNILKCKEKWATIKNKSFLFFIFMNIL